MESMFSSRTTMIRVRFGQAIWPEQLPLSSFLQGGDNDDTTSSSQQEVDRRAFCQAYNEIVAHNYSQIRLVQLVSLLGPLAGIALIVKGVAVLHAPQQGTPSVLHSGSFPPTTLLFGPLVVLVSVLTSIASSMYLRQDLIEQLQALCEESSLSRHDIRLVGRGSMYYVVFSPQS